MTSLDAETLPSTATAPTVSLQAAADPKGRPQKAKDVQQQLAAAQLPAPGQQQTASGQVAVAGQQQGPLPQLATAGAEGTKPMGRQRTGGVLVDGPDYVEDKKETQPPVMDTIKLTNGCTLRWASAWTRPDRHAWTKRDWQHICVFQAAQRLHVMRSADLCLRVCHQADVVGGAQPAIAEVSRGCTY